MCEYIVELIEHFYLYCQTNLDKFLVLYSFVKLGLLSGKVILLKDHLCLDFDKYKGFN